MTMTEVRLARARIESGKIDRLRAWFDELGDRESEVIETLRDEGVYTETAFVHSTDEAASLYAYLEADDLESASEAWAEAYEIEEEHHDVLRETLTGEWEPLETIGHFTNPSMR